MTDGMKTSEYWNNKLSSLVASVAALAAWIAMFADVLSENGAVVITGIAGVVAAISNGSYAVSRGLAKSGGEVVIEEIKTES